MPHLSLHGMSGLVPRSLSARGGACKLRGLPFEGRSKTCDVCKLLPFRVWLSTWRGIASRAMITFFTTAGYPIEMHETGGGLDVDIIGSAMDAWLDAQASLMPVLFAMQQMALLPMHLLSALGMQTSASVGWSTSKCSACLKTDRVWCKHSFQSPACTPSGMLRAISVSWPVPAGGSRQQSDLPLRMPERYCMQVAVNAWDSAIVHSHWSHGSG